MRDHNLATAKTPLVEDQHDRVIDTIGNEWPPRPSAAPIARASLRRAVPVAGARMVAIADLCVVLAVLLAVLVAHNLTRMPQGIADFLAIRVTLKNLLLGAVLAAACAGVFRLVGLYDLTRLRRWSEETRRAVLGVTMITPAAALFAVTSRTAAFRLSALAEFWLGACVALALFRTVRARYAGRSRTRLRVLIVGTGRHALRVHQELCSDARVAYEVVGFVDSARGSTSPFLARRTLGTLDDLERILAGDHIDEVRIGLPVQSHYLQIARTLKTCERLGVKAAYHADIFDTTIATARVRAQEEPVVEMQVAPDDWRLVIKRAIDLCGAAFGLVLLSPVMLAAALAIKATSDGPIFYAQERYGLNRRRFRMLKFRTMVVNAEAQQAALESRNEADGPVFKIACDPRVTPIGRFLRKTSIDELPQLVNVLRGEMSLVGPRPLPLRDVRRFTRPADLRRFSVRPGLTCLWQVSGRSGIGFDEWVRLDLQYIDGWSLGLDFTVLVQTLPAVLRGTGAA